MSVDAETLAVYAARAAEYAAHFACDAPGRDLSAFIAALPRGARVLDLGCGPGDASALMARAGLVVDPVDASPAMIAIARDRHGLPARAGTFDDLDAVAEYAGVWASFSLLHAPRTDFPRYLAAIHRALIPGGMLYLGMKLGTGQGRDGFGRFYTYYSREDLGQHLTDAGFTLVNARQHTETGFAGMPEPGLHLLARVADA